MAKDLPPLITFHGEVVASLRVVSESHWSILFQNLAQNFRQQMDSCSSDQLASLQQKVQAVKDIAAIFEQNRSQ